jgi:hypothetical protein
VQYSTMCDGEHHSPRAGQKDNFLQVSNSLDHRQIQVLHQMLQSQQSGLLAEVTARDSRIQQLSDDNKHSHQLLAAALQQMQAAMSSQKHEAEQVSLSRLVDCSAAHPPFPTVLCTADLHLSSQQRMLLGMVGFSCLAPVVCRALQPLAARHPSDGTSQPHPHT